MVGAGLVLSQARSPGLMRATSFEYRTSRLVADEPPSSMPAHCDTTTYTHQSCIFTAKLVEDLTAWRELGAHRMNCIDVHHPCFAVLIANS